MIAFVVLLSFSSLFNYVIFFIVDLFLFNRTTKHIERGLIVKYPSSRKQIFFKFLVIEVILLLVLGVGILGFDNIWSSAVPNIEKVQTHEHILTATDYYSDTFSENEDKYTLNANGNVSFGISENDDIIIREYTIYTTYDDVPKWQKFLVFFEDSETTSYTIFLPKNILP